MHHPTFDTFVRRAASLPVQDRRSFLGGLSAALPAIAGLPLAAEAKKHKRKKRNRKKKDTCKDEKGCRQESLPACDLDVAPPHCRNKVKDCCEKACESLNNALQCVNGVFD
jgi:hypothetical protein